MVEKKKKKLPSVKYTLHHNLAIAPFILLKLNQFAMSPGMTVGKSGRGLKHVMQ